MVLQGGGRGDGVEHVTSKAGQGKHSRCALCWKAKDYCMVLLVFHRFDDFNDIRKQ